MTHGWPVRFAIEAASVRDAIFALRAPFLLLRPTTFHFEMNPVKAKCDAYRTMVKAEAKFIEAKENYYNVNKTLKAKPNIEKVIVVPDVSLVDLTSE